MLIKKPLILLSGPDGSGKTTLAVALKKDLENKGYKVKITWIRGTHTIAYLMTVFLKKIFKMHGNQLFYHNVYIPRKMIKLWVLIELISVIPLIIIYYHLSRLLYVVISERSLLDFAIWVLKGLGDEKNIMRTFTYKIILILVNKYRPIYITADIRHLIMRKPSERFFIMNFYPYFQAFSKVFNLITINTSHYSIIQSINKLKQLIGFS